MRFYHLKISKNSSDYNLRLRADHNPNVLIHGNKVLIARNFTIDIVKQSKTDKIEAGAKVVIINSPNSQSGY